MPRAVRMATVLRMETPKDGSDPVPNVRRLLEIMARLRGEGGCPWDREQTHRTLKPYLVEECHEFLEAVDRGGDAGMVEELGDILLQVVFHSRIAAEEGRFTFDDVAACISDKLERRHPHVFGGAHVDDAAGVVQQWDRIKREEKIGTPGHSILAGVPPSLPALHRAQEVQKRAARVGFDWQDAGGVIEKIDEEVAEVKAAMAAGDAGRVRAEIGDLLFAAVNLCRFADAQAEDVLNAAVRRFAARFQEMEERVSRTGRHVEDCSLEELDAAWNEVKRGETAAEEQGTAGSPDPQAPRPGDASR